ncbi:MAG: ZmpA/ZmpB/ZmpC family metallo-endopeptidase-related protein, partial [Candidatus Limisoma sp.]|nr:ZmpA/ZmpB/ZmpC family metallo-endopeptidase-related protein [Candidatus Limisoma sp.]
PAFTDSHAYPGYIQNGDTYEIFAPEGLQWLANEVNSNTETFAGKTVVLTADIDMEGKAFTPIGTLVSYPSKTFAGTFDGQNHTIYNLTTADYTPNHAVAGLFGSTTGTIKNVTLKNVNIRSSHYAGAIVAYSSTNGAVIENCHVDGGTVTSKAELIGSSYDNGDKVGGIAGYIVSDDKIDGCTVKNLTVQAYRDLGGIVGCSDGTVQICTVGENVTIIVDNENNYKNYTQPAQYNANSIVGRELSNSTQSNNNGEANIVRPAAVATVATAAELKTILNTFGAAGAGSNVVEITNDIVLADGETWTPVLVDGYHGAEKIIINGNNHTIKGLNAPLFSGGFAGHSGIIIRDLTIIDSNMTTTNTIGAGCFIESIDSMEKIELTNCHVKNTTLTSTCGSRVGGIIGWTAGYNNPNDGPVDTYVTIKNCSVIGCTLESNGSVGGIYGHAGNNPATFSTVENCTVQNCNLISTDNGGWRVGVVVGTANVGQMTINNITESGNTLTQTGKTAPAHSNLYGRFVPGSTGKLTIDGVVITE